MTDFTKLLERVARELAHHAVTYPNQIKEWRAVSWHNITEEEAFKYYLPVLQRELLPLLQAGQACHDQLSQFVAIHQPFGNGRNETTVAWDAALAKLEGKGDKG